jgi:hypothetical protein
MAEVPHFVITDIRGQTVRYRDIWQQAELVLVTLAGADPDRAARYVHELDAADADTDGGRLVVTREPVAGLPAPGMVIADRWGEIQHVAAADATLAGMPHPAEVADWVRYVRMRCPECEGEWR